MKKNKKFLIITMSILIIIIALIFVVIYINKSRGTFESFEYKNHEYLLFVPSKIKDKTDLPLVVMLHGCTQDPETFADATRMNEIANKEKFLVLYPKQPKEANSSFCWNWFNTAHQARGFGEPELIVGMVNDVKAKYDIANDKVYVSGLSAGGAMAVILGVTYPDVFSAVGVGAGLEYKAVTNPLNSKNVLENGGPDPKTTGNDIYQSIVKKDKVIPIIVFHGADDTKVKVINAHQIITQFAVINDLIDDGIDNESINDTASETNSLKVSGNYGKNYTQYIYTDKDGNIVMEKYIVDKMGHAWSGGDPIEFFTEQYGPDQSKITWEFFKKTQK